MTTGEKRESRLTRYLSAKYVWGKRSGKERIFYRAEEGGREYTF